MAEANVHSQTQRKDACNLDRLDCGCHGGVLALRRHLASWRGSARLSGRSHKNAGMEYCRDKILKYTENIQWVSAYENSAFAFAHSLKRTIYFKQIVINQDLSMEFCSWRLMFATMQVVHREAQLIGVACLLIATKVCGMFVSLFMVELWWQLWILVPMCLVSLCHHGYATEAWCSWCMEIHTGRNPYPFIVDWVKYQILLLYKISLTIEVPDQTHTMHHTAKNPRTRMVRSSTDIHIKQMLCRRWHSSARYHWLRSGTNSSPR